MAKEDLTEAFGTAVHVKWDDDDPWAAMSVIEIKPLDAVPVTAVDTARPFNGSKPLIAVNMVGQDSDRGDMHGFMGIAEDIARKIDGEVLVLRDKELDSTMETLGINPAHNQLSNDDKVRLIFRKAGNPDFYFARQTAPEILADMSASGCGVLVTEINEKLPEFCGVESEIAGEHTALPHHIDKAKMEWEGHLFAQEYEDLPRPFIALHLADGFDPYTIKEQLARHAKDMPEATFFVTSCHRTKDIDFKRMIWELQEMMPDRNLPVIGFDKKYHDTHHAGERLNPYIGLTATADHVVVCGYSASMISERIATGRSVITDAKLDGVERNETITSLYDETLTSRPVTVQNITAACADSLIGKQQKLRESNPAETGRYQVPRKI